MTATSHSDGVVVEAGLAGWVFDVRYPTSPSPKFNRTSKDKNSGVWALELRRTEVNHEGQEEHEDPEQSYLAFFPFMLLMVKKETAKTDKDLPPEVSVQRSVLDRLGEMFRFDGIRSCKVGDGARYF